MERVRRMRKRGLGGTLRRNSVFQGHHRRVSQSSVTDTKRNTVSREGRPCTRCEGNGWIHTSSMRHDTSVETPCYFCCHCDKCKGSGVLGLLKRASSAKKQGCLTCLGRGWSHAGVTMTHDELPERRCFFCKNCRTCGGSGYTVVELDQRRSLASFSTDAQGLSERQQSRSSFASLHSCRSQ